MGTLDLLLLEEIRQLSVSIQNVQYDIRELSDKLDVHLKSCPSANCQKPSETETHYLNVQCQCHTPQGQGHMDTDARNLGQGHGEAIVDDTTFIEHPECDQSHETFLDSDYIDGQNHFQGHNNNSTQGRTNFQDRNDRQDHDDFQGHGKFGGHSAEIAVDKPIDATDSKPIQDERCSENEHNLNVLNKSTHHSCKTGDVTGNVTVVARQTTLCEETVPKVSADTMNNTSFNLRASSTNSYQYVRRSTHRRSMKERQRQCLRLAIQQNILMLLDHLPFIRGDLLDQLIECLTDNECTEYTDTGNGSGKDKVRNMMRVIRGRSFEVMERFLKCLEKIVPDVVEIIRKSYEKCLKDNQVIPLCCFCLLKQSVDVKTVGDVTWSSRKISDSLYDEIVIGKVDNELLWHKFASECNSSNNVKSIITTIMNYLRQKGQYRELVNRLGRMNTVACKCFCQLSEYDVTNLLETDSEDYTPHSSMSSVLTSSSQNLDSLTDDDMPNMLQFQEMRLQYSKFRRMLHRHAPLDHLQVTKDALHRSRSNSYDKPQRTRLSVLQSDTMSTRRASMFV